MRKVNFRYIYIYILLQGIFSFNNGLLNATQLKSLSFNKGFDRSLQTIGTYDQILSKDFIYSKEDIFKTKNHYYSSKDLELAKKYLPSEIKNRKIIKIRFDEILDLITNNSSEYKAAFQRVEQSKNRLLATISTKRC